jgi:hypothetical protein
LVEQAKVNFTGETGRTHRMLRGEIEIKIRSLTIRLDRISPVLEIADAIQTKGVRIFRSWLPNEWSSGRGFS